MNITQRSLKQIHKSLVSKEISVEELTREYLTQVKNNAHLNAFISVTENVAFENAKTAQKIIDEGKATVLTGIPCSIKDNIYVSGIKTTNGSNMLADFVPAQDAELIRKLKSFGYVLIGKTNMDEFAMGNSNRTSAFGKVFNPHGNARVPGGSSGGSAASVAAKMCAYSIGTDTGGSVRQPASHCGITGLKPTYGRISRKGVTTFADSLDTVGALAKTAEDCAVILDSLADNCNSAAKIGQDIKGLKIAIVKELFTDSVDVKVREAVISAVDEIKRQGTAVTVTEISMPNLQYTASAYFVISSAEGVSALSEFGGKDSRTRGFGDEVKRRVMLGNFALSDENKSSYFRKALAVQQQISRDFDELFGKYDVMISPVSSRTAFPVDEPSDHVKIYSSTLYTVPANLAGLPSVSTPCNAFGGGVMPIGMSITGKKFDEATVLQVASFVETLTGR